MKRILSLMAVAGLSAVASCDPCFGTSSCTTEPRAVVTGQIVDAITGDPVDGIPVRAVVVGGPAEVGTEVATTTSSGGHWRAEFDATEAGEVVLDVTVSPPTLAEPYTVPGVRVPTVETAGEAHILPRWVANPWFNIHGELFLRGNETVLITNVPVVFTRTSGAELTGPAVVDGVVSGPTDAYGRVQLFQFSAFPDRLASVTGDLTVMMPAPYGTSVVRDVELTPTHEYRPAGRLYRLGVGPSLDSYAIVIDPRTGVGVGGVRVVFRRTGGIGISPSTVTTTSDASGWVRLEPRPLGIGEVVGDLTVTLPSPAIPIVIRGFTLATHELAGGRNLGQWSAAGPNMDYYVRVADRATGAPVAGVGVVFRRTGGISITPSTITTTSDAAGWVRLQPRALGNGDVIGDLTITPPSPYAPTVITGFRLATFIEPVARSLGVWQLDRVASPVSNPSRHPAP